MRLTALIVAIIYLQGCTTMKVIDLATGLKNGAIQNTADVEAIWNDHLQNEFIICLIDRGNFPNKRGDRYMLRIPNDLISQKTSERVEFEQRTIYELKPKEKQSWWSSTHQNRKDVKVYDLSVVVDEYSCIEPKASWNKIHAIKQITPEEVSAFQGETIKKMVAMHEPFLIFSPPYKDFKLNTVCSSRNTPCLLLVSKTHIQDKENPQIYYDEIFSVDQLIWASEPNPIWYLTIPFALVADAVIISIFVMIVGIAGGGGKI